MVAEGMIVIRRLLRIADDKEGDKSGYDIDEGFKTVRQQRNGARHPPGDHLQPHDAER